MTAGAALGVVGLLAIAPAAALTASALPQPLAASTVEVPSATLEEVTRIRQVPVGLPKGTVIGSLDDVRPFAVAAIGPEGADRLIALLTPAADGYTYPDLDPSLETYPYRFGEVDRILDGVPEDRLALDGNEPRGSADDARSEPGLRNAGLQCRAAGVLGARPCS